MPLTDDILRFWCKGLQKERNRFWELYREKKSVELAADALQVEMNVNTRDGRGKVLQTVLAWALAAEKGWDIEILREEASDEQ
jgi:hypothetical protein